MVKNAAFVFLKPHAVTDACKTLVKETFEKKGFTVVKEGSLEAKEIDEKQLIDNHYYAIASKATILKPDQLNVPKEKFKEQFGLDWDETLKTGKVVNAKDGCEKLGIDADALDKKWGAAKKAKDLVKFGGGFYCAKIEDYYIFNGFFMSMRSKFVKEGTSIYWYLVEWDIPTCSWEDFRGKILGPTDPADAPADSLRGIIYKDWKKLGLAAQPDTGDNGVHASASPFEALAERMNWLGYRVDRDNFGKQMLKAGIKRSTIKDWSKDPQVTYGHIPIKKSLFDSLEDTDADYCLALCQMMAGAKVADKKEEQKIEKLEKEVAQLKKDLESFKKIEGSIMLLQTFLKAGKASSKSVKEEKPAKSAKEEKGGKGSSKGSKDSGKGGKSSGKGGTKDSGKGKGKGKESEKGGGKSKDKGKGKGGGKGKGKGKR